MNNTLESLRKELNKRIVEFDITPNETQLIYRSLESLLDLVGHVDNDIIKKHILRYLYTLTDLDRIHPWGYYYNKIKEEKL